MSKYINKDAIVAEIDRRIEKLLPMVGFATTIKGMNMVMAREELKNLRSFINTLEVEEIETPVIPKHSYFEQIYHCGSEPRWKIGDVLAAYEFYSDHEGEHVYGEVIGVRNDETCDDWIYTMKSNFGGYEDIYENMLISDEAYKKN